MSVESIGLENKIYTKYPDFSSDLINYFPAIGKVTADLGTVTRILDLKAQ